MCALDREMPNPIWRTRFRNAVLIALVWIAVAVPAGRGMCDDFKDPVERAACHMVLAPILVLGLVSVAYTQITLALKLYFPLVQSVSRLTERIR